MTTSRSNIPSVLCYPYLLTTLATKVVENNGLDFVYVFEQETSFRSFRNVFNPSAERIGYYYDPIAIQDWI